MERSTTSKDTDKGPVVTDVLTNSQVSDPELFKKAIFTEMILEEADRTLEKLDNAALQHRGIRG